MRKPSMLSSTPLLILGSKRNIEMLEVLVGGISTQARVKKSKMMGVNKRDNQNVPGDLILEVDQI